jgi:hypothetical protein
MKKQLVAQEIANAMSSRIWMPSDAFAASGIICAVSAIQVEKLINATSNQTDQRC